MQLLDDFIPEKGKITYNPDCKATFKLYRKKILTELLYHLLAVIALSLIICALIYFHTGKDDSLLFVLFLGIGVIYFFYKSIINLLNILWGKLVIDKATFKEIKEIKKEGSFFFWAKFDELRDLKVKYAHLRTTKIPPSTEVYVIRTGYSKELIDLVPVSKVNK